MNSLKFEVIKDSSINEYLKFRNLKINLDNSVSKKKIKKLDHYIWWLKNQDRKSYIVKRNNVNLLILYYSIKFLGKKRILFPGYFVCGNKLSIKDILTSIKWQNNTINKKFNKKICVIIVPKNNIFSNAHSKYFKYKILKPNNPLHKQLKKIKSFNQNFNVYIRY